MKAGVRRRNAVLFPLLLGGAAIVFAGVAEATTWRIEGYYHFFLEVPELGYTGEARLDYKTKIRRHQIDTGEFCDFPIGYPIVQGVDSVNGGPWKAMLVDEASAPSVALDGCGPWDSDYDESVFLRPIGATNFDAGQFSWGKVPWEYSFARFEFEGVVYRCDGDDDRCYFGSDFDTYYTFNRGWELDGTAIRVAEPSYFALLGLGLAGLGLSRRRRA